MGRRSPALSVPLALSLSLGGCFSGEPSAEDMLQAFRAQPGFADMAVYMFGDGQREQTEWGRQLIARDVSLEKYSCAAAAGSAGYVCDYRFSGNRANGQVRQAPNISKARFFKGPNGWQVALQ